MCDFCEESLKRGAVPTAATCFFFLTEPRAAILPPTWKPHAEAGRTAREYVDPWRCEVPPSPSIPWKKSIPRDFFHKRQKETFMLFYLLWFLCFLSLTTKAKSDWYTFLISVNLFLLTKPKNWFPPPPQHIMKYFLAFSLWSAIKLHAFSLTWYVKNHQGSSQEGLASRMDKERHDVLGWGGASFLREVVPSLI